MAPLTGSLFCFAHDPERAKDRAKARRRGGRQTRTRNVAPLPAEVEQLRTVPAIQAVLERVVFDTLAQKNTSHRSRAIGALLMIALKALEVGELEARLAAIEERLTQRPLRSA